MNETADETPAVTEPQPAAPRQPGGARRRRVIHFVTGGGSGATRVALNVAIAQQREGAAVLLVLRRKRAPLPEAMRLEIAESALPCRIVENLWPKFRVVWQLEAICRGFRPDVFFAHGYSEHLWGRKAALAAGVAGIIHVEHNREKYFPLRLWQARALARRTDATVCVSESVLGSVLRRGLASRKTVVIHNGIALEPFAAASAALDARPPDIVMAARFARQKDHATLIRAARLLADAGWRGRLFLAGDGPRRAACERLAQRLGLRERVVFTGRVSDLPALLARCRVCVLSTHYEGLPLALIEGMAAGCLAVASDVHGVGDILRDRVNGRLFTEGDAVALAEILDAAFRTSRLFQPLADAARASVFKEFSLANMTRQYSALCEKIQPD